MDLEIKTPEWCLPLLEPSRYKGAKGGRGSGKSHFFAELLIEEHIFNPNQQSVCIREIQKSLRFSAKRLIEDKIRTLGVSHLFKVLDSEIRNIQGNGIIIFQGMQDHTADSIKSLEGFDRAWVEEAQSISARSLELLLPTIRAPKSEIWFSWNPDQADDPVERLFSFKDKTCTCVHANYTDNPFCPDEIIAEAERHMNRNPDTFGHVWMGDFNELNEKYIFSGKYCVREFDIDDSFGAPLHGLDFGFAQDPTAAVQCYFKDDTLYIRREAGKVALELDETAGFIKALIPDIEKYTIRADCARPESISYLQRHGMPKMIGPGKLKIEDGIEFLRSLREIVVHPDCPQTAEEFRKYSFRVDRKSGDILPDIVDNWNHYIDAIRYALYEMIKSNHAESISLMGMF